jgi:benzodiazapine receptor
MNPRGRVVYTMSMTSVPQETATTPAPTPHRSAIFELTAFICAALGAGIIGAVFTAPNIPTWYATLIKPAWNPPAWLFAPVWNALYVCIGTSGYLVWRKRRTDPRVRVAVIWFAANLFLNAGWSLVFFALMHPAAAFLEIIALWLSIAVLIVKFRVIDRNASLLLVPYFAWVTFAAALNFAVWRLNA